MKKWIVIVAVLFFFSGCKAGEEAIEPMLQLRSRLLQSGCSFDLDITADFGEETYGFSVSCTADTKGNITFQVQQPQSIAGISGKITAGKGEITFDGTALAFELLADGQLSPVSSPLVPLSTARSGYVQSGGKAADGYQVSLHDSYRDNAMDVEVWLDGENLPVQAEVLFEGRRILTMEVKNFVIV